MGTERGPVLAPKPKHRIVSEDTILDISRCNVENIQGTLCEDPRNMTPVELAETTVTDEQVGEASHSYCALPKSLPTEL